MLRVSSYALGARSTRYRPKTQASGLFLARDGGGRWVMGGRGGGEGCGGGIFLAPIVPNQIFSLHSII